MAAALLGSTLASTAGDRRLIPSFSLHTDARSFKIQGNWCKWAVIERTSPDGQYVAQIVEGDAEADELLIGRAKLRRMHSLVKSPLEDVSNVNSCIWVPGQPHTLAFGSGGEDYGVGLFALWLGPHHRMVLQHANFAIGDGFSVCGATTDGKTIIYEHSSVDSPSWNETGDVHLFIGLRWTVGKLRPAVDWR
jgi:hypothetical protein